MVSKPVLIFSVAPFNFVSPLAICDAALSVLLSKVLFPSWIFCWPSASFFSGSSNFPSMAFCTSLFILSILSCCKITDTFFSTAPDSFTEATPSTLSSSGMISCSAFFVTSVVLASLKSNAATITGIISGFSFIIVGLPIPSSHRAVAISRLSRISTTVVPMSVPSLNSMITTDMLLIDIDCTFFTLLILDIDCSIGSVTARSTSSGLAPA